MKISIKYENTNENKPPVSMTIEVPDEDCTLMIEADYQNRLEEETDNEIVKRRNVQEIMDERFNKLLYNNWHKEHRRRGQIQTPFRKDDEAEDESDGMETVPDYSDEINRTARYEYDAVCQRIRQALGKKQDWADMFIAVRIDSIPIREYAASIGVSENNITQKLKRAEKKLQGIFKNRQI
ncbi:sigma-70 family RNA polymerase sigma factor [Phascolarctobacterium faecium]|jgi:hypothetical protein|uniref:sigma-70 family RNA polymerase sigma factor n=1 Tax=Phascolarctobacterium faecium TaxID=33025 RepID=UPI0025882578|nr:sigma-70 family RNA polymerase sigma factor [uncultured Phascolarctobacterium sp.]